MTAFRIPRTRHLRKRESDRITHARYLDKFVTSRATALGATGAAKTATTGTYAYGVAATGVLTASVQPANNDTVTIGTTVYTFKTTLSSAPAVAYEVLRGADAAASHTNLTAAINGTAGEGATYGTGTVAHTAVTAVAAATTTTLTSIYLSTAGNSVATTETGTNTSFAQVTLTGGQTPTGKVNITSHGYSVGDGPFRLTTTGTLPGGLAVLTDYYVRTVVSSGVITLTTDLQSMDLADITSAGSGTHTITKAGDYSAVFDVMKHNHPKVVAAAIDIDAL